MTDTLYSKSGEVTSPDLLLLNRITQRKDFLRLAKAQRVHSTSFVLQSRNRKDDAPMRVGFTCSKKVGNAVARNRAKRRLREIARLILPISGQPGHDYVLIGRANVTATTDFAAMQTELAQSLQKLQSEL
ncbi:MAG: ribonuclease P protein component [Planktomarina sp.]|jgi:ribonuclease P protein component|tara:strand:- start:292 stop:681 length:390 start_codon:yes stop_codon:yes gene_type:complete